MFGGLKCLNYLCINYYRIDMGVRKTCKELKDSDPNWGSKIKLEDSTRESEEFRLVGATGEGTAITNIIDHKVMYGGTIIGYSTLT